MISLGRDYDGVKLTIHIILKVSRKVAKLIF